MDRKKLIALLTLVTGLTFVLVIFIFAGPGKNLRSFKFGFEIGKKAGESEVGVSSDESSLNENESLVSGPEDLSGGQSNPGAFESEGLVRRGDFNSETSLGVNVNPGITLNPFQADQSGKYFGQAEEFLKKEGPEKQVIGNLPVDVYENPDLSLYLNLQSLPEFASSLYVMPVKEGFEIVDRHEMPIKSVGRDELIRILEEEREESPFKSNFYSLYHVYKINDDQAESIDNDSKLDSKIGKIGDGLYAVYRDKKNGLKYDQLRKQMGQDPLSLDAVFSALSNQKPIISSDTSTGEESAPEPDKEESPSRSEWEELRKTIAEKPSAIEWKYLLPLYGSGNYEVQGEDVRRLVPKSRPVYSTGVEDINGDGREELLIHCSMRKETEFGIGGYWAVMTPSEKGLLNTACYNYGNGDMLLKNGNIFFTSLSRVKDGMAFELLESNYPMTNKHFPIRVEFLQPKGLGHSLSGKKLAEDYPNYYIMEHGGQLFLVVMQDYDYLMEYARNRVKGAIKISLEEEGVSKHLITNINNYLSDSFPNLPFSADDLDRAKPVASLAKSSRVVTFQDFRKD